MTAAAGSTSTIVLVHGAGHTASAWDAVRAHLRTPSIAVDLPGRRDRPGDIATLTLDDAADSVARDVQAAAPERVVLVGHSAGGIVLPAIAARLGRRVEHLVFLAGLNAAHGTSVGRSLWPPGSDPTRAVVQLREGPAGRMLEPADPGGWIAVDASSAMRLDSLNLMSQVVSWEGVAPQAHRTFVRPTQDRIQPPDMQEKLIMSCGATRVIDVEAGHNAALEAPEAVAAILDVLAAPVDR